MRIPAEINNDEELEASTNALFQLTALENPSRSEREAIELLTLLVERYAEKHYPAPAADAVSVVRFLLEQQDLTQCDLISEFGDVRNCGHFPQFALSLESPGTFTPA